ncbi:MAG: pantoate--beta-alanine ligase [Bacteroidales bacterium]|nr:pantoate--beta-alanine ligase [Bacteroidales bacterium]
MNITKTIKETKEIIKRAKSKGLSTGFVPTMGALHKGHLELIRKAKNENDFVSCSIFVNPIQFNNKEDLKKYPRPIEDDIKKLEELACDLVFIPSVEEMYPEPDTTIYNFGNLEKVMEGKHRPGHFNGVAVVVKKLFDIVEPGRSYFGEKDFQQLAIIKALVKKLKMPVEIVPCPTIREKDGLAMSSRNRRLTADEREIAPVIYMALKDVSKLASGKNVKEVKDYYFQQLGKYPQMKIEYFEISNIEDLSPVEKFEKEKKSIACTAVFLGKVRLIDNVIINL